MSAGSMNVDEANGAPASAQAAPAAKPERGKPAKLVDRVFDQLQERIRAGNYPPDSRLPGEHELASMLGVSRPIIRDALAKLRDQGMVYARQGAGTFVSANSSPTTHLSYSPVKTFWIAAKRRDEAAIQKIATALADLREATSHQLHRTDADFNFHRAVTEAANNHYYTASIDALKAHIAVGMHLHGLSLLGPRPGLEQVFQEHNTIYKAIAEGRADDARNLMQSHLEGSRDRLFEGRALDLSF
jgi:GntR family transcriptional repressor for pyruvate dehydrogenase complex